MADWVKRRSRIKLSRNTFNVPIIETWSTKAAAAAIAVVAATAVTDDHHHHREDAAMDDDTGSRLVRGAWGRDADQLSELIFHDEFDRAGVAFPDNQIGIGWAGPTILAGGTDAQQARYLPSILDGRAYWCQLFSEPEAGSDLASLRPRAVRDGDTYVIDGQKVWSTWAERSDYGILLARTDPEAPKHAGISYFVLPMDTPGVTVRPIREMTGETHFNETFLEGSG
jgi:alkylation response protein AidB-like acyl-CoA dehydrogenase